MTRNIRMLLALFAALLLPTAAWAADDKPADDKDAKPAEEVKPPPPAAPVLPSVLSKFNVTFYGYVNFDAYYETTRSYDLTPGNSAAKDHTVAGNRDRAMFSAANSRFGFRVAAPEFQTIKASALIEGDFGSMFPINGISQDGTTKDVTSVGVSESTRYSQGLFRLRQANMKLETPIVDVLMGQTWNLLSFQSSYFPASAASLGLPGEPFGRTPQIRVSKLVKTPAVNVEVAGAVLRPPQRDAVLPDFQAGGRVLLNGFKAVHTPGATGTGVVPASLSLTGAFRRFKVSAKADPDTYYKERGVTGYALAVDTLIPVIPSWDGEKGNKVTLLGTFVLSKGASDLIGGMNGGASGASALGGTKPDGGQVLLDTDGDPHAVDWKGLVVGAEYYFPPAGRGFASVTYARAWSSNVDDYDADTSKVYNVVQHVDGNVFFDVTPAVRLGVGVERRWIAFASGDSRHPYSDTYHFTSYYVF
jgi:hypothetical protein